MKLSKKLLALVLAGTMALSSLTACGGGAQNDANNTLGEDGEWHPTTSINIRVPFAAGGSADTICRIAAKGMEQKYGQSVIVNNLTGANGAIAINDLDSKDASPTELMVAGIALFTLTPLFSPDIQMNLDDYEVVGSLVSDDFILLTNPAKSGIEDVEGLIEYGKTQRIICSANAAGGATHMLAKAFFGEAGVDCEVLAADSGAQNALAVASGDAVCAIVAASAATQYIEDGSLKALACFSPEPFTGYEGLTIPTVKDMGYGEYFATNQEYIRKYRFCNAFHPFHGFSMMSCGHIAEMNTSAIYIVGAQEPGIARGMGLKTRATFEEALEDAKRKFVGQNPNILALPQTFKLGAVHLCMKDDDLSNV